MRQWRSSRTEYSIMSKVSVRHRARITLSVLERFSEREPMSGCWLWTGGTASGYGRVNGQYHGNKVAWAAHRISFELHRGKIPKGLDLDHLCRVRSCINPDHLEPVTRQVNLVRGLGGRLKTHCPKGHSLSGDNILWHTGPEGFRKRKCKACQYTGVKDWAARNVEYRLAWQRNYYANKKASRG